MLFSYSQSFYNANVWISTHWHVFLQSFTNNLQAFTRNLHTFTICKQPFTTCKWHQLSYVKNFVAFTQCKRFLQNVTHWFSMIVKNSVNNACNFANVPQFYRQTVCESEKFLIKHRPLRPEFFSPDFASKLVVFLFWKKTISNYPKICYNCYKILKYWFRVFYAKPYFYIKLLIIKHLRKM